MKGREENTMNLKINDIAPDFVAETTQGTIRLHEWMKEDWVVLFSHPKTFTPICTGELASLAVTQDEFASRNVKLIGVGADPVSSQMALADQIRKATGSRLCFPMIGDTTLEVLTRYNMLTAGDDHENPEAPSTARPQVTTVRSVYLIAPDKRIRLMLAYPMETARNFNEILRVIDSIRLTALYNAQSLRADEGSVPLATVREDKRSRGLLDLKTLFASLRHEILPF